MLGGREVAVGLEGLQAVDKLLVGLLPSFEVVEVCVVVEDNSIDLVLVALVDEGDLVEKVYYYLDVFQLLAGLDFPVKSEAVVVGEDGLGVLGHHDHPHLLLDELEVELGPAQVSEVLLVPPDLQQPPYQLELEQKVNVWIIAPVYQPLHHPLNSLSPCFFEEGAGPAQNNEVHVEGKFEGGNVGLLLGRALPVDQAVGDIKQVQQVLG